jgi:hypothetical protein
MATIQKVVAVVASAIASIIAQQERTQAVPLRSAKRTTPVWARRPVGGSGEGR